MERTALRSESLASVGYDANRSVLEVQFTSGEVYRYYHVPVHVHRQLMAADSHGRYFSANIRLSYRFLRLSQRPSPHTPGAPRRRLSER